MNFHLSHLPEVQAAIAAANSCTTIEDLQQAILDFDACDLARNTPAMPGRRGSRCTAENPVMILGKAPAGTESETRVPFSGPAGKVLRQALDQAGYDLEACWITCASYWKARKDNTPNATQLAFSRPFLFKEIELVKPSVIIALGQKAHEGLFQVSENIGDKVGTEMIFSSDGKDIPVRIFWCHAYVMYGLHERMPIFQNHIHEAANDHPAAFQTARGA